MQTKHQIKTHTTTTGLKLVIVPRPGLSGFHVVNGVPSEVMQPSYQQGSKTGFSVFTTLFGLNLEDFDRIQPAEVYYELGDGTYLMATAAACLKSARTEHRATSDGKPCFEHRISDLVIAELPELEAVEEIPIYHF